MARRKFDQYFRAGAVGLAQKTDPPAAQLAGDLGENDSTSRIRVTLPGQRTTAGQLNGTKQVRSRAGLTRPQKCALALMVVSTGVSALLGARTWSTLIPIGVSALLSGVVWTTSVWLLRAWRSQYAAPARPSHPFEGRWPLHS